MLKIRLKRTGKRNAPSYRIVVMDSKKPRDGKAIEELGYYNPAKDPDRVEIDEERL
ncbi:MAG: 30S ribosomal protein S16, partial [Patescibacteria group bacterium]